MLDGLRDFSKTWIAKILIAVLVVSFGAFGINNVLTGLGSSTVAHAGGEDISVADFQRAFNNRLNSIANQLGSMPTTQDAVAMGVPSQVLTQLIGRAALDGYGKKLGLGASDDRLALMLQQDPTFGGMTGQFQRANFSQMLAQMGYTESDFFDELRAQARRQQLASAVFSNSPISDTAKSLLNRYAADTRTIDYFVLNATSIPMVADPTDEELTAYLTEHQADYRTKEARTIDLISLSPATLAASQTVTDEEVAAEYERTKSTLGQIERRHIVQVILPTDANIALFTDGKAAGKTFADLVTESGLATNDLGTLARNDVVDSAVADAAFGLAAGDFAIIDGISGKRAIAVTEIEGGTIPTLDEVRDQVAQNLKLAKARNGFLDVLDQIEELRASFQPLADIATRFNLPLTTVAITADGTELGANADLTAEDFPRVAQAVFAAEQGKLAPTVAINNTHNVWFDLKSIEPARDQTLDEVRDAVTTALIDQRTEDALAAEVETLKTQLAAGSTIDDLAVSVNAFPQISAPITRSGDGTPVLNNAVASAAFAGGPGHFGAAQNGDGDYVVFKVAEVTPADGPLSADTLDYIENQARDSVFGEFVAGITAASGARINEQVVSQILSLDTVGN